eukprot:TRINITY_DN4527_c0_g1_i1.p1 TRINITY_DN4527_c0_g1~~TRINITY_DN4527_c0_g1_i1.p1  ORF type:complete len:80 (+),score=12.84 TRINITY_DN4527_c0_g1_i1:513-752(+)
MYYIPNFMRKSVEFLCSDGMYLKTKGLFRVCPSMVKLSALRQVINYGDEDYVMSNYHPNTVAGIMKMFLRELPEPLVIF